MTLAYLDRATRTVGWGPTFDLSGDVTADMDRIREFYADKRGIRPELTTAPRLREEDTRPTSASDRPGDAHDTWVHGRATAGPGR